MSTRKPAPARERALALLTAYAESCNIREACRKAKVNHKTHYRWLEKYHKYADSFKQTQQRAAEYLESVAVERATVGTSEIVFYQGQPCGTVQRYSDGLMQFLLRGAMPAKYGAKTEISGPQGQPIQAKIEIIFVRPGERNEQSPPA